MTESVPGCNLRIFPYCHYLRPLSLATLASSPIGGAKGGCAAGFARTYPLRRRIPRKTSTGTHLITGRVPVLCCILSKGVVCL